MTPVTQAIDNKTRFEPGKWTTLARSIWLLITLVSIGFYLVSAWSYYRVLLTEPFIGSTVQPGVSDLEYARLGLARLGLSINAYSLIVCLSQATITVVCCLLGSLIFWRRPTDRLAWLMSLILVLIGTQVPVQAYALAELYPRLGFLGFMTNQVGTMVNMILIWVFPNGRFVPAWSRWTFLLMLAIGFLATLFPDTPFSPIVVPFAIILVMSGFAAQAYRYVRVSTLVERQQTKWVVLALMVGPLVWVISGLLIPAIFPILTQTSENAAPYNLVRLTISNFASLLIPLAIGISLLRYRLFDIDIIIRRTLVYTVLTAMLGLFYFGMVILLEGMLRSLVGSSGQVATVVSTLAIAALFTPLRRRVQDLIDRRFYRRKYNAEQALAGFAAAARDETDLEALSAQVVNIVQDTMQPDSLSLWIKETHQ